VGCALLLRSTDDLAFLGEELGLLPKYWLGESPSEGDDGDDPTDELSVIEAPLDLEGIDEVSESFSEVWEECDEIEDTFLNF